ncbi:MAG TPA: aspartate aminotransferase family protein [Candidatus Hypogeohydataceae bacterium YC41]
MQNNVAYIKKTPSIETQCCGPEEILRLKQSYLIPCVYHFYKKPMQLVRGNMQYLYDHTGKRYLDFFAGVSVANLGHCNPEVTERVVEQLRTLQHTTSIYLTQPVVELARRLAELTPGRLQKTFFCASGSEANEGAVLLAQLYTKRKGLLALSHGLHGHTKLTLGLTGLLFWKIDPYPCEGISFIPSPYCYRCPLGVSYPSCNLECINEAEKVIKRNPEGYAAIIAEPIHGNGGIIVPPKEYFPRLKKLLDAYGILFVADEVQTGFSRTGKMFAVEHWNIEPDIMTLSKALTNGFPGAAFITRDEIASTLTRPYAATWGSNPVMATAGLATLDVIKTLNLEYRSEQLGAYLIDQLLLLKQKYSIIGDVRGLGLMIGAELVNENKSPAADQTDFILEYLKDHGILVGKTGPGRNVLTFQPPLIITKEDVQEMLEVLEGALQAVQKGI